MQKDQLINPLTVGKHCQVKGHAEKKITALSKILEIN